MCITYGYFNCSKIEVLISSCLQNIKILEQLGLIKMYLVVLFVTCSLKKCSEIQGGKLLRLLRNKKKTSVQLSSMKFKS